LKFGLDAVHAAGGVAEGCICYTGDISNPQRSSVVRTLAATGRPPCAMPGRPWADAAHVRRRQYTLDYYMEMADALVEHGVHTLAIKDMAGLLKPRAATTLLTALRERFPDVPLHVHTHDTAGTGVATQLACAAAGADIVDCCIDAMSGAPDEPRPLAHGEEKCALGERRRRPRRHDEPAVDGRAGQRAGRHAAGHGHRRAQPGRAQHLLVRPWPGRRPCACGGPRPA